MREGGLSVSTKILVGSWSRKSLSFFPADSSWSPPLSLAVVWRYILQMYCAQWIIQNFLFLLDVDWPHCSIPAKWLNESIRTIVANAGIIIQFRSLYRVGTIRQFGGNLMILNAWLIPSMFVRIDSGEYSTTHFV